MSIYPNVRCTTCNGQVYVEDGDVVCLLCARVQKGTITRVIKEAEARRRHPRIGATG